jgi:hypothetical protein
MVDTETHDIFVSNIDFITKDILGLKLRLEEALQLECDRLNLGTILRLDMPRNLNLNATYAQAFLVMVNRTQHREVAQALNGTVFGRLKLTLRIADRPSRRIQPNKQQENNIDEIIGQIKTIMEQSQEKNKNIEAKEQELYEMETKLKLRQLILKEKENANAEREAEITKAQTELVAGKNELARQERQARANVAKQQKIFEERERVVAFKEKRYSRSLSRIAIKCVNQNRTRTVSRVSKNERKKNSTINIINKEINNQQQDQTDPKNDDDCILVHSGTTTNKKKKN